MRKGPDANSELICKLAQGTYVQIIRTNVNAQWHEVKYNGQTGYINRIYICLDSSMDGYAVDFVGTIINCKENVNVRSGPSTDSKIIGVAQKDTKLTILPQDTYIAGWYVVKFEGQTGYISADYLDVNAVVGNNQLSDLAITGGTLYPSFSPNEYGYVIKATGSSVTINAKANSGVDIDINNSGKSSCTIQIPSAGMKTVRISLDGKIRYSLYISRELLTVGTWNIKRGDGKLLMQGRLVYDQQPDIMGIQEVYQKLNAKDIIDNLQSLKTKVMSYSALSPTINYPDGGKYGDGLLSRYKLSNVETFALDSGSYEKRLLQRAIAIIGGKTVSIYNTHFSYNSAAIREKQFAKVLAIMDADKNKYKILTGDFNAAYSEFSLFKNYTVVNSDDIKYYDYNRNEIGYYSLDNIIVSKNIKVVNSRIIINSFSDHYMVLSYLILN
jgi:endonuclease/exonuclease/phosphatase family metal-dependent hydrolase/uncharacterized protein YraI